MSKGCLVVFWLLLADVWLWNVNAFLGFVFTFGLVIAGGMCAL